MTTSNESKPSTILPASPKPEVVVRAENVPELIRYFQSLARTGGADKYGVRHVLFDLRGPDWSLWPQSRDIKRIILVYQAKGQGEGSPGTGPTVVG